MADCRYCGNGVTAGWHGAGMERRMEDGRRVRCGENESGRGGFCGGGCYVPRPAPRYRNCPGAGG